MWNKSAPLSFQGGATTLVSRSTTIRGDVVFSGHLEVEGEIIGKVVSQGEAHALLRVLRHGRIEGEVRVPAVVVNGKVVGDIHVTRHIELGATAEVDGDIYYATIEMVKGAQLNGRLVKTDDRQKLLPASKESVDAATAVSP